MVEGLLRAVLGTAGFVVAALIEAKKDVALEISWGVF
jgi:hypothetical protein